MKNAKQSLVLLGIAALLGTAACDVDEITHDCTAIAPTYTNSIKAIMDSNCAFSGCHSNNSQANGIDLSSYSSVSEEADKKRFRGSIEHVFGRSPMPKNRDQLSEVDRQQIYCWIQSGRPE